MRFKPMIHSAAIILAFLVALFGRRYFSGLVEVNLESNAMLLIYAYAWWILPVVITTAALYGFRNIFRELGLQKGFLTGLAFSAFSVLPMFIGAMLHGPFDESLTMTGLLKKSLLAGLMEEILFRGFLFGLLFRKLKWGFIPASLPGAVIFGIAHMYQGSGMMDTLGIFIVTTIGAMWFAWLYIEWNENLWVPVILHILMNLSWTIFDVSNNALGDWSINISRMTTIALTVIITIILCRRRKKFNINKSNVLINA
jgi:uncharacterized protein